MRERLRSAELLSVFNHNNALAIMKWHIVLLRSYYEIRSSQFINSLFNPFFEEKFFRSPWCSYSDPGT